MKALLSLRITVDHDDRNTPVYAHLKLYPEDGALIWRIDSECGDECETLPRPTSIEEAKADARLVYRAGSTWHPVASWL